MYCDFLSMPFDENLASKYITAVGLEFNLKLAISDELETVYIGGGTPTTLSPVELTRLFTTLRDVFAISADAEITIEANPGTLDKTKIASLLSSGVNRFSIGIQSFHDNELKLLERVHSASAGIQAVELLRAYGAENLSVDLMYGIPGQTLEDWSYNLSRAIELSPEHISAYELTPEGETPLYKAIAEKTLIKPGEDLIVDMYYHTIDVLTCAGYTHYEISNFAREGFECRHNMNYWNRGEYIGIGAGAHSFIDGRRIENTDSIKKYIASLETGMLAEAGNTEISSEDAIKELIFLGLRKTKGLDIIKIREDYGIDIAEAAGELIAEGLLLSDKNFLRVTRKGIVLTNSIIVKLLEKLHREPTRSLLPGQA